MMRAERRAGSVAYSSSSSDDDNGVGARGDATQIVQPSLVLDAAHIGAVAREGAVEKTLVMKPPLHSQASASVSEFYVPSSVPPVTSKGDAELRAGDQVLFLSQEMSPLDNCASAMWELGRVVELRPAASCDDQNSGNNVTKENDVVVIQGSTGSGAGGKYISATRQFVRRYSYEGSSYDLNDLSILSEPSEAALLYALRQRYFQGLHYTFIGRMLLAVNPYQGLDYPSKAPHPRHVAEAVRKALYIPVNDAAIQNSSGKNNKGISCSSDDSNDGIKKSDTIDLSTAVSAPRKPVALLVTGDSGAGKTETVKLVLFHLLGDATFDARKSFSALNTFSGGDGAAESAWKRVARLLDAANCLLESFGNASTPLNNNSSRFAKWVTVLLDSCTGVGVGAEIRCYLLETSRLATRSARDSPFHVFGALFDERHGLTPDERTRFDVWDPTLFRAMQSGDGEGCFNFGSPPYTLSQVRVALESVGLSIEKIDDIIRILCGILHLLNIEFTSKSLFAPASVAPKSISACKNAERLLGFSSKKVQNSLGDLLTTLQLGKDVRQLHAAAAEAARDSVASRLYESLFCYILGFINESLLPARLDPGKEYLRFSILDIFGFEVKDGRSGKNDLEQLLINYANEVLQRLYEETTFESLQVEGVREGVQLGVQAEEKQGHNLTYELFVRRPYGVLSIIEDDTLLAQRSRQEGGTNLSALLMSLQHAFPGLIKPHREGPNKVSIQHYCGTVVYDTENMSAKNRVSTAASTICSESTDAFVLEICNVCLLGSTTQQKKQQRRSHGVSPSCDGDANILAPRLHATTLIAQFRAQMEILTMELKASETFWIRCIKPNNQNSSHEFDSALVLSQLHYAAVPRSLMLFGYGYCHNFSYQTFVRDYLLLAVRGYCCEMTQHDNFLKRERNSSGLQEGDIEGDLHRSLSLQRRAEHIASIQAAAYRAGFREACLLATQLVPFCMNRALLLGASKVFMCSDTLRMLLALGDLAKMDAACRIERVGRGFIRRRLLVATKLSLLKEARIAAIRERIAREMPEREALERDRENMLLHSSQGRAEHLASLSRRAMRSVRCVERCLRETMWLLRSELAKGLGEMNSYETARLKKEKEVWDEAVMEELYRAQARESVEREKPCEVGVTRRRQCKTPRQGMQRCATTARRSRSDIEAEREEAIRREIISARQLQLRVEQEVSMERRQRAVQLMERREAKKVRMHLETQQQRIVQRFHLKDEVEKRHAVTQRMCTQAHSVLHNDSVRNNSNDMAKGHVEGTMRDHTVGGLMASIRPSDSQAASHNLLPLSLQQAKRESSTTEKDCDRNAMWAVQKDMMLLWEALHSERSATPKRQLW